MQTTAINPELIDGAVVAFLLQHGVSAKPPGGMLGDAVVMGLLIGFDEDALAGGAIAGSAVKKASAKQEWTSWKQWTLSHADWPAFRDEWLATYDERKEQAELARQEESRKSREAFKLQEEQARAFWNSRQGITIRWLIGLACVGLIGTTITLISLDHQQNTTESQGG